MSCLILTVLTLLEVYRWLVFLFPQLLSYLRLSFSSIVFWRNSNKYLTILFLSPILLLSLVFLVLWPSLFTLLLPCFLVLLILFFCFLFFPFLSTCFLPFAFLIGIVKINRFVKPNSFLISDFEDCYILIPLLRKFVQWFYIFCFLFA